MREKNAGAGATRVLTMSTLGFTVMFAVWLMFGILGIPIQQGVRPHRRPAGLDRPRSPCSTARSGGCRRACSPTGSAAARSVTFMLLLTAIPAYFVSQADSYGAAAGPGLPRRVRRQLLQRRHRLELGLVRRASARASRSASSAPATSAPRSPSSSAPAAHRRHRRAPPTSASSRAAGASSRSIYAVLLVVARGADLVHRPAPRPDAGPRPRLRRAAAARSADARLALQPLLRRGVRRLRRAGRLAAEVLRRQLRRQPADRGPAHRHLHLPGVPAAPGRRLVLRPLGRPPGHVLDVRGDDGDAPAS